MNKLFLIVSIVLLSISCTTGNKRVADKPCCELKKVVNCSKSALPDWAKNAVIYEVNVRQYTPEGTIVAFEKHLPRLKEMGVDLLWLMPIHPISVKNRKGTLGSYYAVQDYNAFNPEFGTIYQFNAFVKTAHNMGFKVIIDWVANHTGYDNVWVNEHPDWFVHDSLGKIIPPVADWSDVADLNYDKKEMRLAMIDAMKFWLTTSDIDGFRCDVAGWVPVDFWNEARLSLDSVKPVFMLAEDEGETKLLLRAFSANYGWNMHSILNKIAKGEANAVQVKNYIAQTDSTYPCGSFAMHFTSNHDENSWNGTEYERLGDAVKTMAALTFTLPGMPLIYSGQEAALNKRLKFFDKDNIDWSNLEMQQFYKKLISIKRENKALINNACSVAFPKTTGNNSVLVFKRTSGENSVVVIANLTNTDQSETIKCSKTAGVYTNAISGEKVEITTDKPLKLSKWQYMILTK